MCVFEKTGRGMDKETDAPGWYRKKARNRNILLIPACAWKTCRARARHGDIFRENGSKPGQVSNRAASGRVEDRQVQGMRPCAVRRPRYPIPLFAKRRPVALRRALSDSLPLTEGFNSLLFRFHGFVQSFFYRLRASIFRNKVFAINLIHAPARGARPHILRAGYAFRTHPAGPGQDKIHAALLVA